MSVQTEIDRINASVTSAYAVLEGLGATMPDDQNVDNLAATMASMLANIPLIVTTEGTGAAYTATVPGMTELKVGSCFIMIPHTVSTTTNATLNVNGFGAKRLIRITGQTSASYASGYSASWISKGVPVLVIYSGTYWVVQNMIKPSAADINGTVAVNKGGTGNTSLTSGSYLVGNGTSAVTLKTPDEVRADIGSPVVAKFISTDFRVTYRCITHTASEIKDLLWGGTPVVALAQCTDNSAMTLLCWMEGNYVKLGCFVGDGAWSHEIGNENCYVDGDTTNATVKNELWLEY